MLSEICKAGVKKVAIVGIGKHAGKTTVLNHLLAQAEEKGIQISIQSIGVDGEAVDSIIGVPKPAIHAPAGTLLATAAYVISKGTAELSLEEATDIDSPLGKVYIAQVKRRGTVILAGIRQAQQVKNVLARFTEKGAALHLVDGAFDRISAAASHVTDGVILVTGGVMGRSVEQVVQNTFDWVQRFRFPCMKQQWEQRLFYAAMKHGSPAVGTPLLEPILLTGPAFFTGGFASRWPKEATALAVPGAVTDKLLLWLEGLPPGFLLILPDGTHLFASNQACRSFLRHGHQIAVAHRIPIVAMAVNPHSVEGYDLPRKELKQRIKELIPEWPVFDVIADGK